MYSTLNKTKFGNCITCGAKDTEVVKVKKDTYCTQCHQKNKALEQIEKQKRKKALRFDGSKVRKLGKEMRTDGIVDSQQELIIDLDRVASRMVRLMNMGADGKIPCFTCSSRRELTRIQCGHFIPRANLNFRFDWTYNLRPQCPTCNIELRGNLLEFEKRLNEERPGIVDWMREEANKVYSPTRDELKQLLVDYQFKLNQLEKAKGLKP